MPLPLSDQQISEFRHKVCTVAASQFAEFGVAKVSMRSLAQALGCSATSLYNYFANKEEILSASRAMAYDQLADSLQAAEQSCSDLWQQSRAIGDAYVAFAEQYPAAYQLIFAFRDANEGIYPPLQQAEARARQCLTRYIDNMIGAGLLSGDPTTLAHVYWAGMHGLIQLRMAGQLKAQNTNFDSLRHEMMRLITRGALPTSPTSATEE